MTFLRRTGTLVVLVALVASARPASSQPGAEPYEVPAVMALTGQLAFAAHSIQQSLILIEKIVNATGGIQGHPLKIVYNDDASNPANTVQLISQQMGRGAPLILGPSFVPGCQATTPLIAKAGPVALCYSPGISPTRGSYIFSAAVNFFDQYRGLLTYLHDRGWTHIALLMTTDAQGQQTERAFDVLLARREYADFQVVSHDRFSSTEISVVPQIQHIRSANPDVIIASGSGPPLGTILRSLKDAGVSVPIVSSFANMTYAQMEQYKNIMPATLLFPGLRAMTHPLAPPGPIHDAQLRYFAAYDAIGVRPDNGSIIAWDLTWAGIDALRHLGVHATAEQIRNYIENLHGWVGINGVYDFGDAEHRGIGAEAMVIDQWDPAKNDFIAVSRPGGHVR